MGTIFISYRRMDSKHATSRIHDRLRVEFGKDNVFKDVDSIPIGTDFRVVLRDALKNCRVVLVMIGPGWVTTTDDSGARRLMNPTDFVRLELETALDREIPVVPVLLDGAPPPRPDELPESLQSICYKHAIAIGDDPHFDDDVARLIRALNQLLGLPYAASSKQISSEKRKSATDAFRIANAYISGTGVPRDDQKAREWYEKAAAQGHARAQYKLGVIFERGYGVRRDVLLAREWYEKAAAQGHRVAQYKLGMRHFDGEGGIPDYTLASEWFQKAAAQGHTAAKFMLGRLCALGCGLQQDDTQARRWFQKAAEEQHVLAQYYLALFYYFGRGGVRDHDQARKWFGKAAVQSHMLAQYYLGTMYYHALGGPRHYREARSMFLKAAAHGHAAAQYYLGVMTERGRGMPKHPANALEWYRKAAEQGHEEAKKAIARLEKR
jgi:TPR repeat protein